MKSFKKYILENDVGDFWKRIMAGANKRKEEMDNARGEHEASQRERYGPNVIPTNPILREPGSGDSTTNPNTYNPNAVTKGGPLKKSGTKHILGQNMINKPLPAGYDKIAPIPPSGGGNGSPAGGTRPAIRPVKPWEPGGIR